MRQHCFSTTRRPVHPCFLIASQKSRLWLPWLSTLFTKHCFSSLPDLLSVSPCHRPTGQTCRLAAATDQHKLMFNSYSSCLAWRHTHTSCHQCRPRISTPLLSFHSRTRQHFFTTRLPVHPCSPIASQSRLWLPWRSTSSSLRLHSNGFCNCRTTCPSLRAFSEQPPWLSWPPSASTNICHGK
jgi:hypothetical protein